MKDFLIIVIFICCYGNCFGKTTLSGGFQIGLGHGTSTPTTQTLKSSSSSTTLAVAVNLTQTSPSLKTATTSASTTVIHDDSTAVVTLETSTSGTSTPTTKTSKSSPSSTTLAVAFNMTPASPSPKTATTSASTTVIHDDSTAAVTLDTSTSGTTVQECGQPSHPDNGEVDSNGTAFQSVAEYSCHIGYDLVTNTSASIRCLSTGKWSYTEVTCEIKDCGELDGITNGNITLTNTIYGAEAYYHCNEHFVLRGKSMVRCGPDGNWSSSSAACIRAKSDIKCKPDTDDRNTTWPETKPSEVAVRDCSIVETKLTGTIRRECGADAIWKLPKYDCINQKLLEIAAKVEDLKRNHSAASVQSALTKLATATTVTGNTGSLYDGELEKVTTILETIATVSNNINVTDSQSQDFINTASNLLDTKNQKSWEAVAETDAGEKKNPGVAKVLEAIDTYASAIANTLLKSSKETKRTVQNENMALQVAKVDTNKNEDIHFPDDKIKSISTKSSIDLKTAGLKGVNSYSAVIYRNLSGILPPKTKDSNSKVQQKQKVNSVVLSLDIHGGDAKLKTSVTINLEHFEKDLTNPLCSFWNTTLNAWDSQGCTLVSTNSSISVCQCTHLTNFAILMSPWTDDNIVTKALDVISTVGCSISLAALIITVAIYRILWRYVKSNRHVMLMHLSTALAISYVVFLAGVDRTENKGACTAIAVILQYIYLAVFFLMLVQGIELAVMVLYVFPTKSSRLKWMIPLAWGVPAIIVGISLAVTQLKGYGTDKFCWLSIDDGLIWGFVGPALCVILVNMFLLALVIKKMCQKRMSLATKSNVEKAKTVVRTLCVLLPLMGVTWVLGMFYVNKDFAWMQYAFAVCNSLQGLVIFIVHCALNPQIRSAVQRQRKKYFDSNSLPSSSTKQFSMPRVSRSSSNSGDGDFSHSRSYNQDSFADHHQGQKKDPYGSKGSAYTRENSF